MIEFFGIYLSFAKATRGIILMKLCLVSPNYFSFLRNSYFCSKHCMRYLAQCFSMAPFSMTKSLVFSLVLIVKGENTLRSLNI